MEFQPIQHDYFHFVEIEWNWMPRLGYNFVTKHKNRFILARLPQFTRSRPWIHTFLFLSCLYFHIGTPKSFHFLSRRYTSLRFQSSSFHFGACDCFWFIILAVLSSTKLIIFSCLVLTIKVLFFRFFFRVFV